MGEKNLVNPEISTISMETKLNIEKIQELSLYKQLEEKYGEYSIESLSKELLRDWEAYQKHGNFYANIKTFTKKNELKYALQAFSEIQQKKLFNIERKWRAGKVQLDIISSYTFDYYYKLIHECPFIEPVTEIELAAYKEYLFELDGYPEYFNANLEHVKLVMAALNNTSEYPRWYKFFDDKFNTRDLLFLEDLVYEKEDRCVQKYFDQFRTGSPEGRKQLAEEFHAIMDAFKTGDFSNIVVTTKEKFLELAHFLNDKKYAAQLHAAIDDEQTLPEEEAELAYNYLESFLYNFPAIKKNYSDWKDGLYKTASEHLKMNIIKLLDEVYEDYKVGKLNDYEEETREKAKKDLDYWQNAYLDGKKKLEQQ